MSVTVFILVAGTAGIVGIACGYALRWLISLGKKGSMELRIRQMKLEAEEKAKQIVNDAEQKSFQMLNEMKEMQREKETQLKHENDRLIKKEESLDKRQEAIDAEGENLKKKIEEVKALREQASELEASKQKEIERVSGLSREDAREELLQQVAEQNEEDITVRLRKLEQSGQERVEQRARELLATAIHRLGNSVASDVLTTTVTIPNEEVKGKIIGKEGRNIRAFERAAGVELVIDDTPGTVVVSAFDPVRRQVARVALENLILDGRIQPARIEEVVAKAQQEIDKIIKEKGEQAAYECGVYNIDQRVLSILGRLYFRTSYGQNVLQHSIEMAHIAGMLAEELGGDVHAAKAGALLHDIGKAVDHEVQGTHVEIGRRVLQKFGVDKKIIQAMQSHHEEYPYETLESVIVQVADAISGGRPGARRDTVENYLRRLNDLEAIANSFEGVEKVYAIQAGREVRVFVYPDKVSDLKARETARAIAQQIERDMGYPGEIKITVIRENRVVEYAR